MVKTEAVKFRERVESTLRKRFPVSAVHWRTALYSDEWDAVALELEDGRRHAVAFDEKSKPHPEDFVRMFDERFSQK